MKVPKLWLLLFAALAVWGYFGFPSPDVLLSLADAQKQCAEFAQENREKLFYGQDDAEIKAVGQWLKNGKVVVEVAAMKPGDKSYMPRLCVIGGGRIEIVSILENGAWR